MALVNYIPPRSLRSSKKIWELLMCSLNTFHTSLALSLRTLSTLHTSLIHISCLPPPSVSVAQRWHLPQPLQLKMICHPMCYVSIAGIRNTPSLCCVPRTESHAKSKCSTLKWCMCFARMCSSSTVLFANTPSNMSPTHPPTHPQCHGPYKIEDKNFLVFFSFVFKLNLGSLHVVLGCNMMPLILGCSVVPIVLNHRPSFCTLSICHGTHPLSHIISGCTLLHII